MICSRHPESLLRPECREKVPRGAVFRGEDTPPAQAPRALVSHPCLAVRGQKVPPVLSASCVQLDPPPFTPVSHMRKVGSAPRLGHSPAFGGFLLPAGETRCCWRHWWRPGCHVLERLVFPRAEDLETERSALSLDTRKDLCCNPRSKGTVSKSCRAGFTESLASEAWGALWDV